MPRIRASTLVRAPWTQVAAVYREYERWPQVFSATIRGVRLVCASSGRVELEVDHRDGRVPNVMSMAGPHRVDLWEAKRRYDATFVNHFEPVPDGTRYVVEADVRLKGAARLLGPMLGPVIRRRIARYVLEPVRAAAEARASAAAGCRGE